MRVKAKVSFGGQYAMYKDAEADLPDNPVTRALIDNGFIEEIAEPEKAEAPAEAEKPAEVEAPAEKPEVTLSGLTKAELLKMCEEKGIEVDKKARKEDLIKALEA